jgi:uncharacterized protein YjiS (DUF1127 family)
MSTFFTISAVIAFAVIAFAVERVAAGALRQMRHKNAVNELMRLDDRMLADIGLHRCEILSAVIEADDVHLPRERRHSRAPEAPRQASWQGGTVRPLKAVEPTARPANDPTQPRRSA